MSTRNYTNVIFGKFRLLCVDSSPCSNWSQTLLNSPSYWLTVTLLTFLVMRGLACYHDTPLHLSVSEIMKSSESNVAQCCHSRPPALTGDQVLRARPAKWQSSGGTPATGAQERERNQGTCHHWAWWHGPSRGLMAPIYNVIILNSVREKNVSLPYVPAMT